MCGRGVCDFRRCIDETWRNPFFPKNEVVTLKTFLESRKQNATSIVGSVHHKICNKVHLQGSSEGEKLFLSTGMPNASRCVQIELRFVQVHAMMRSQWIEWMKMGFTSLQTWRVLWVNWSQNRRTWNTSTELKAASFESLSIELPSIELLNPMYYWQPYPPLVPTVVLAIFWGLPLPPALEEQCRWCGYFFCSPYCPGQQQHQHLQHFWGAGPWQNPNRMGVHNAGTLFHNHTLHMSSSTITGGGYTALNPSMAWMGANDNTGSGQV